MDKGNYIFRRLAVCEAPTMFQLISRRIRWMDENGIRQWNETQYDEAYPPAHYEKACQNGTAYGLIDCKGTLMCAAIVLEKDEYWPEDGVKALYMHALASRCDCSGAGAVFLREAENLARSLGKEYLRLDSQRDNEKLAQYYEKQGFCAVGECEDGPYTGTLRQKKV